MDALAEGFYQEEPVDEDFIRFGSTFEEIKRKIYDLKPDMVGVSCLFSAQTENVYKVCSAAKSISRGIITVLGGAHPSAEPKRVLADNDTDYVVIGEGERTLVELADVVENRSDLDKVDGIGFRKNGTAVITRKRIPIENLDGIEFPYWDIFPLEKYFKINNPHGSPARKVPFLPLITSRGCPFECIFCSIHNVWGRNYRKRSAENVLMEIEYLMKRFGVKEILFEDDNLTLDGDRAKRIFSGIIAKEFNILWNVPNGVAVQTLDGQMLDLMKKSGCYAISIGIESGDEYMLKNVIKKPIELSQIKPIIDKSKTLGLETSGFFVVGLPGETRKSLKNTFRFAENLQLDTTNFFYATPLPGTRLLETCKSLKLIDDGLDYARLKSDYPSFETKGLPRKTLMGLVLREKLKLYFLYLVRNPKKFLDKIIFKLLHNPLYFLRFCMTYFNKTKTPIK